MAADSVIANSRNSRPTTPPISKMGMNTATKDRLIDSTVKLTSRAPCTAALNGATPFSMWREMFSSITTASSTTNPVATVRAISEILFRLKPARYITPKVPISDTETATLGMRAARTSRRKRNTTNTTRAIEINSVCSTPRNDARMVGVRSDATAKVIAAGIEARNRGNNCFT